MCVKRIITLCVAASEEEEQENDHEAEEYDKIEDKESNSQLKSHRKFLISLDDSVYSANRFVMKCQDDKQI